MVAATRILLLEDLPGIATTLAIGLNPDYAVIEAPCARENSLASLHEFLQARAAWTTGERALKLGEGQPVDILGLNANFAVHCPGGCEGRRLYHGLKLLEWIRKELRLTVPIVLWSFLSLEGLRAQGVPILQCNKGLVFLPLPASVSRFRSAFEQALSPEHRLSPEELRESLALLYGSEYRESNPLASLSPELRKAVAALVTRSGTLYQRLSPALAEAVDALDRCSSREMYDFVGSDGWINLFNALSDIEKHLSLAQRSIREVTDVKQQASVITSFCYALPTTETEFAQEANSYRSCTAILRYAFDSLIAWADAYSLEKENQYDDEQAQLSTDYQASGLPAGS